VKAGVERERTCLSYMERTPGSSVKISGYRQWSDQGDMNNPHVRPLLLLWLPSLAIKHTTPTTGISVTVGTSTPQTMYAECKALVNHCRFSVEVLQKHGEREAAANNAAAQLHGQ